MTRFFVMIVVVAAAVVLLFSEAKAEVRITVDISEQVMWVDTPTESYTWEVSTARKGYHTPRGIFQPYHLAKMHYSKKYDNAPMPNSIFFHEGYAIHATYDIKHLGRPASHGCIRLDPQNAQWLFHLIKDYGKEDTTIVIQD